MIDMLTKPDLQDSSHEVAIDLVDSARAGLAVFDRPLFTSAGVLKDPYSARRAVQDAVTLLQRSAALLQDEKPLPIVSKIQPRSAAITE